MLTKSLATLHRAANQPDESGMVLSVGAMPGTARLLAMVLESFGQEQLQVPGVQGHSKTPSRVRNEKETRRRGKQTRASTHYTEKLAALPQRIPGESRVPSQTGTAMLSRQQMEIALRQRRLPGQRLL